MNGKHSLIMVLCCLVPLAAIFAVTVLGIPLSGLGTFALVLLCPLMHIFMMRGMGSHNHQDHASHHSVPAPKEIPAKAEQ